MHLSVQYCRDACMIGTILASFLQIHALRRGHELSTVCSTVCYHMLPYATVCSTSLKKRSKRLKTINCTN